MTTQLQKNSDFIPLVFPLIFSSNDFVQLDETFTTVKNEIFDYRKASNAKCDRIWLEIASAFLNVNEIISNQNSKGYRYNSYCLQMCILKLEYSREMIIRLEPENYSKIYQLLSNLVFQLRTLLRGHYQHYLECVAS
jgi:hypothetical protein